jgi:hypothetical protein
MWFFPQFIAFVCLVIGHMTAVAQTPERAGAQPVEPEITVAATSGSAEQYAEAFDLAWETMHHKILYATLNEAFKDSIGTGATGLTMSQMLYLLQATTDNWDDIRDYMAKVPSDADAKDPQYDQIRAKFRAMLDVYLKDEQFMHRMARHNNPTQPLLLEGERGGQAFTSMKMYVNHPSLVDPNDPSKGEIPADNLRQLVVDFIKGAETEIWYNVFDFDLKVVADALVDAHKNGREVHGGIDKSVVEERPEVQAMVDILNKNGDEK